MTWFSSLRERNYHNMTFFVVTRVLVLCRDSWQHRFSCRDRDNHDKGSGVAACCDRFGLGRDFLFMKQKFYVATEFSQSQELLCRDSVLLLCRYYVKTKVFLVTTETVTTRDQGCDRAWLRPRDFMSRQKFIVSQQDFIELCRNRIFFVATECGLDKRIYVATNKIMS